MVNKLSHKHVIMKTHVSWVEFDDIVHEKLAINSKYFGEGNSKDRRLEFDFEYCLGCGVRLLDRKPILTRDILEGELEKFVTKAKNGDYVSSYETTMQHTDFETLQRLIQNALAFGQLLEKQ